jgi:DNA mismatch endonuclease (patch repair protein)
MADVHDKITRSFNMSRIRATNTKPELLVRRFLHAQGFRYKLHDKTLPGKPDLVFPKYKTVIFIHACLPVGRVASGMVIPTADTSLFPKQELPGG